MIGPGKYDELATLVREKSEAAAVVVAVLGGNKGSGFSVQALPGRIDKAQLAMVLRDVADALDAGKRSS